MKSNTKKRLIAFMLCMVLVLSSATSAFADEPQNTDSQSQTEAVAEPAADEATGDEAAVNSSEQQQQEEQQPEQQQQEEQQPEQQQEQQQPEQQQPETEAPTVEAPAEQPAAEEAQPIQQLTYENDNVKITVDAVESGNIPEGATLSVTPIIKQEITDSMSDEEKTKAEELNNQYDFTENKLKEKAEDESYDIAGFLAYNITFVDADGNKMEPNGNVKVTMDYKQPVIAEDAVQTVNDTEWLNSTKDLDVTVLHLEEDNKGKVTDVVDMTAEDTNGDAEINTTSENEIQKVTITTNSFSTFAIAYNNYSVDVKYVDQNETEITSNQFTQNKVSIARSKDIEISNGDKIKIPETVTIDNKTYRYSGAHLDSVSGKSVYSVKVNKDGEWKYKEKSGGSNKDWNDGEGGTIYLVYQEQTTALPTVGTIDSTSKGITMRMINYSSPADGLSNDIGGPYTDNNKSGGIKQNLLNRVLTEGYPVTVGGTSLKTLFTGGTNVNHLFLQSSFDADGSYEYSSFKNYAHLEDNGDFTVYDALGTPSDEGYLWYRRGNFMPYNSISASDVSTNKNLYDESGNPLSDSDPAYGKTLYKTQGTNDYWFGMYVEADFNQPSNGKLTNGSDMVYEFNGDDDLWVYVDGVLMLDIGGIHDAHSGSINFATGAITYDSVSGTTIKAQFKAAGVFPDGSPWDDSKVSEYFNGDTLKYISSHNFKMFYMERGAGASNLKMKFNLEVIPTYEVNFNKVDTQGVALPGAEFEIRDDNDNSRVYNVTSGSDGGVSVRLHEGTYTMTETQAPTGYLAASGTWKIKVNTNGTYTIKKNGQEIAKDSTNVYKIVNKGQHEDAEANLTTSKTVKVTDYDKREYEITLGASTSGREAGTEAKAASVVLVLDRSGSMGTKGMTALVNAADTFIDTLKDASPDSQVAVVYFNGSQGEDKEASTTKVKEFTQLNTPANVTSIKDFLSNSNNMTPSGGTPMGNALKKAKTLLDADRTGNQQYVLFFTDGLPGHWDGNDNKNCMVANSAVNYANAIKENATIYTVGYKLSGTLDWHQGDSATSSANTEHGYSKYGWYYSNHDLSTSASDFLKDYIATSVPTGSNSKYAYTVDDTANLEAEFKKLAAQIGAYYSINAEKIVDVIDARFELTEAGRKALVGDAKAITNNEDGSKTYIKETRKDGAVVGTVKITENADGTTTIEWTGTEAHIGNKDNEADPAWEKKIGVVAKADFIGGNAVTTNTGDSGVFVNEDTTKMFPKPTVNVKALSLEMTGKPITVYKGDALQPQAYYNQLAQTIKVAELDGTTKTLTGVKPVNNNKAQVSLPALTDAQKNELEKNKTLTIGDNQAYKYIYPGTSDAVGYFKYIYTISETPGGSIQNHKAGNAASPAEKYNLEVVFVPYTVDERLDQNPGITAPAEDGGTVVSGNLTASADYIVNIIDGSIEITKVLETEPKGENGDTFTFTVTGPDNFSKEVQLTVTKNPVDGKYTATYNGDELKHLARGEYTVTEKVAAGYDVKSIENDANATNTKYILNNPEDIHFTMGTVVENGEDVNVIKNYTYNHEDGGTLGKAIFTNEPVYSDWQIIKVSASSHDVRLAGAIFELQSTTDKNVKYYGKSGDAGIVKWYQKYQNNDVSDEMTGKLPTGTYTLKEIKAPTGYTLSSNTYTLQITKTGALKTIQLNGENVAPALQDGKYQILIENTPLYDLPSAGGNGIYLYMIGGILLMFAAAWILYKNKCREVLEK